MARATQENRNHSTSLRAALDYARRGWAVIPVDGKRPLTRHGYKDASTDGETIGEWWERWPHANVGLVTGRASGICILDVDPRNGGDESVRKLEEEHGSLPKTLRVRTGSGGIHYYFALPEGSKLGCKTALYPGVDFKSDNGYLVVPPSRHPITGKPYQFVINGTRQFSLNGRKPHFAPLPKWVLKKLTRVEKRRTQIELEDIIREGARNVILSSLAGSMRRRGMTAQEIEVALLQANADRCEPPLEEEEVRRIAGSISRYKPHAAKNKPHIRTSDTDLLDFTSTDTGNSQRIFKYCGDRLRYCHAVRRWIVFDGKHWKFDDEGSARRLGKECMSKYYLQASKAGDEAAEKFAKQSLDERRINSALSLAQCELPVGIEDLDTDPNVLNFQNGTLDLQTGKLREHRSDDFITKILSYDYKPNAKCPIWKFFLEQILPDPDLDAFLQRILGYSLFGITREKLVTLIYGGGDNGKSTFLNTIHSVLGPYAAIIFMDSLVVRQLGNNENADLADLRGVRFVMTSETEEGQRLNEARLKRITQGMGLIKACRKYENPVTFRETHHLFIDANHRPEVRGQDNAIWSRLLLLPFEVTIPKGKQDPNLPEKLLEEAEGILAWLVRGARRWYKYGLKRPECVNSAVSIWRSESDPLKDFVEARCEIDADFYEASGTLWIAYEHYTEANGIEPLSQSAFAGRLCGRGCHTGRKRIDGKVTRVWRGIRLIKGRKTGVNA